MTNIELPTDYQNYIHLSRYSRWIPEKNRRENWNETVQRYFDFFQEHLEENTKYKLTTEDRSILENSVLQLKTMPSMRCLMTAGAALKRENIAGYNCSFVAVDSPKVFDEILYVLMNGTGVGFSVEKDDVAKLPVIAEDHYETATTIIVDDSKLGWAKALRELIAMLYSGHIPSWNMDRVRPAGSPLKTFGGRASGPEPLHDLFLFTVELFKTAQGRKLTTIECHDLVCKIAEVVVVGGVRRSALISLSDLEDDKMRSAKVGAWWDRHVHRRIANNSAVYAMKPDMETFFKEWKSLYDSKSGERGIFSRYGTVAQLKRMNQFRTNLLGETAVTRDFNHAFGTNPCSEIILRSMQFCNLSEVVVRSEDTIADLKEKVRIATIIGTFQSTLTKFRYLSKKWTKNTEEERLLGVSLTGIMDNKITNGRSGLDKLGTVLEELREVAIRTNIEWADKLGIPRSTAITAVKPSGTVSQLVDSASGIHARHSPFYIRTVRADKKDPISALMIDAGVPVEDDVMKKDSTNVFSFPIKAPKDSIFRTDLTAIEQLEIWKAYQMHWCEHKPSVTVSVKDDEWFKVGAWVYENFDYCTGVSFLPHDGHVYQQAPYQEIDKVGYEKFVEKMPKAIDWTKISSYEKYDMTEGTQELACVAGGCEI